MSSRNSKWVIHETKNGWDLSRGGRYLYNDLGSKAEALKRLKMHRKGSEPVILEELDGYRTNITKQLQRSGLI